MFKIYKKLAGKYQSPVKHTVCILIVLNNKREVGEWHLFTHDSVTTQLHTLHGCKEEKVQLPQLLPAVQYYTFES